MWMPPTRMRFLSGRISVSPCTCGKDVACSLYQFDVRCCVVCSFLIIVSAVVCCQAGCAYERMGLMYHLYTRVISSLE